MVIVEIHVNLAQQRQLPGGFTEEKNRDRVPVDVPQPSHRGGGRDLESAGGDVNFVTLTRTEHRAVRVEDVELAFQVGVRRKLEELKRDQPIGIEIGEINFQPDVACNPLIFASSSTLTRNST
jgi:hypothetical protein